tara:strand:- start:1540 stop:1815 length:276 start_codon:yes stop_codon:yes gene_type:complete
MHTITKKISCDNSKTCCDNLRVKLESKFNCKLMAIKKNDVVNGYISILHTPNNHIINIKFYEKNESANDKHLTTFKKLTTIPTESEIKKII